MTGDGSGGGDGDKWLDSKYILEAELRVSCERQHCGHGSKSSKLTLVPMKIVCN